MPEPVVVGLDGSGRSLRALMWAAHDASLRKAPLRLVNVLPRHEMGFPYSRFDAAEDRGGEIIDEAYTLAGHAYPDVEISSATPSGAPAAVLLGEAEHADALVLGAKGHDVGNITLGSVALQVVGHAACPVVVVGHMPVGYRLIVAGTDGSPDARAALAFAFEQADMRSYRLHVITAVAAQHHAAPGTLERLPEERATEVGRDLEQQIAPLRERYPGVDVTAQVLGKVPTEALADASLRADLVVVGSRGKGGFHGLALGSVSHKLLHLAACPVAVVHALRA